MEKKKKLLKSKTVGSNTYNCNLGKKSVTKKDFNTISIIGQGSYAKVALVQKTDSGVFYALKILKKSEVKKRH
jgi:serine/threonine protein kinase